MTEPGTAQSGMAANQGSHRAAVAEVLLTERAARDRGQWDRMAAQFHADARVRLSWFSGSAAEFVAGSRKAYDAGQRSAHVFSPPDVDVRGARALAVTNACITIPTRLDGFAALLTSYCRLHERLVLVEHRWQILALDVVYLWDALALRSPADRLTIDGDRVAAARESYAYQAYIRQEEGGVVPLDLLGIDEPEPVARMETDAALWLNGER